MRGAFSSAMSAASTRKADLRGLANAIETAKCYDSRKLIWKPESQSGARRAAHLRSQHKSFYPLLVVEYYLDQSMGDALTSLQLFETHCLLDKGNRVLSLGVV